MPAPQRFSCLPTLQVEELTLVPHVSRELMLIKVNCSASQRGELVSLASVRWGWGWGWGAGRCCC